MKEELVFGAHLWLAVVFLMASLPKIANHRFVQNVLNYRILPEPLAKAYGLVLPYLELTAALLLFSGLL
jgi:uncharacterized membrane protein YphA (DoxX/SURF4 family)